MLVSVLVCVRVVDDVFVLVAVVEVAVSVQDVTVAVFVQDVTVAVFVHDVTVTVVDVTVIVAEVGATVNAMDDVSMVASSDVFDAPVLATGLGLPLPLPLTVLPLGFHCRAISCASVCGTCVVGLPACPSTSETATQRTALPQQCTPAIFC